ncbi:MFS general substrate transporter [Lindgomyces ingoldianus]|uniref:MFS general substrate transporter n=1 Tax=Lindgomyces ingoldianus TaxID=673940 RepID=A0ACB6RCH2_9PLEO|nr:MFS general substrate transporter [Lindgomyces ingoldianus]KAF2477033.1 MFS general substrate transporter [Lindgomyces ingoldianus]
MRNDALHQRTVRKLDFLLLPFLALLFLFNSLDKSNIGNAESAHFTADIGLHKEDLNTAVALFFTFFVALQPVGAALGRRYGMVLWVPSCMLLWGISTALHVWVRARWQLFTLRIIIGCLEAGFYPVTVSYLSLFYTRFEFGRRLSLFYGQAAFGGALGGLISYFVFSRFPEQRLQPAGLDPEVSTRWQSWQVLFLLEGVLTIVTALTGYFWLPHSADTAWFLTVEERVYASERIARDRSSDPELSTVDVGDDDDEPVFNHESRRLLNPSHPTTPLAGAETRAITDDRGLTPHDVISAFLSPNIWHILACNILSSIPVYAFSVFLPLVLAPLTKTPSPALVNLLTAPPYICGAITLYFFASYSDRKQQRIAPVLVGLTLLLVGLTFVVALPTSRAWAIPRYLGLNVLLSGTFIASPLTVAWISGNTPSPGKRALLLGINGWGNLAGIFSALLFQPKYAATGYISPFWWTLACVGVAMAGYVLFWRNLNAENERRRQLLLNWNAEELENEKLSGTGPFRSENWVLSWITIGLKRVESAQWAVEWLEEATAGGREGDDRITFIYGF